MKIRTMVTALATALPLGIAAAQSLPEYYPKELPLVGVVDGLDLNDRKIVVNDAPYRISLSAAVATLSNVNDSLSAIGVGDSVAVELRSDGRVVENIWLLPRGYGADSAE